MPRIIIAAASFIVDPIGKLDKAICRNSANIGIGPDRSGIGDPIADFEPLDPGSDRDNLSCAFRADRRRKARQFVEPGPMINIDEIDADRVLAKKYLARRSVPAPRRPHKPALPARRIA